MSAQRILLALSLLVASIAPERSADACCLGCPCTKYKRQERIVELPVTGYTHSIKGAVPRWNLSTIRRALMAGYWSPFKTKATFVAPQRAPRKGEPVIIERPASDIRFVAADKVGEASTIPGRQILIRRIERHGNAILVEVDDRTWKLAPCPKNTAFACLVDPGELALDPIPPVNAGSGSGAP